MYHRKSLPKSNHPEYSPVPEDQRTLLWQSIALVRMANALANGRMHQLQTSHADGELVLRVIYSSGLELAEWAFKRRLKLWKEVMPIPVQLKARNE